MGDYGDDPSTTSVVLQGLQETGKEARHAARGVAAPDPVFRLELLLAHSQLFGEIGHQPRMKILEKPAVEIHRLKTRPEPSHGLPVGRIVDAGGAVHGCIVVIKYQAFVMQAHRFA